jgi:hypothetical protein
MPAGAIGCHNHIVGPLAKYPMAANRTYTPPEARRAVESAARRACGAQCPGAAEFMASTMRLLGPDGGVGHSVRGIAVVPQTISDAG